MSKKDRVVRTVHRYVSQVVEEKKTALVVYEKKTKVVDYVLKRISDVYDTYEQTDPELPIKKIFDLVVYVNCFPQSHKDVEKQKLVLFFTFFNTRLFKEKSEWCKKNLRFYKIVNMGYGSRAPTELIDFVLFKTRSPYSFDFSNSTYAPRIITSENKFSAGAYFFLFLKWVIGSIIILNVFYVVVLGVLLYSLLNLAKSTSLSQIQRKLPVVKTLYNTAGYLSTVSKNTLFWLPTDNLTTLYDASGATISLVDKGVGLVDNYSAFLSFVLKNAKTPQDMVQIQLHLERVNTGIAALIKDTDRMRNIWVRVPFYIFEEKQKSLLDKLNTANKYLTTLQDVQKNAPEFFGENGKKTYLVLFMNNMELRPGGGFIGSVGVVEFEQYTLTKLHIYDVYSLDGQLKTHIDPPQAIGDHLSQPHWFLRDSNFSGDFPTNASQALSFVQKEVGWDNFDGVLGVTFSAVQDALDAFPSLYVPDYGDTVTSDNFFMKAEGYAENKFFSGSHNKKNFLEAVVKSVKLRFEEGDFDKVMLARKINTLMDEKFITLFFKNKKLQSFVEQYSWSGSITDQQCKTQEKCFLDYLYIIDSNLGVNKANFYMQRSIRLFIDIDQSGDVNNTLTIDYRNESSEPTDVGGAYKNYLQVLLPKNVEITSVTVDGAQSEYDTHQQDLKTIGVWFTVPPGSARTVAIRYNFERKIDKSITYQLIVQKQTGSINNDFIFEIKSPTQMGVAKTNYPAVVQNDRLVYNTFLEKDRLLLVSFSLDE